MKTTFTISLGKELAERLERIARETDRQRSWLVSQALQDYLEEFEDLEIAHARYQNPREGRFTEKELREKLGLSR